LKKDKKVMVKTIFQDCNLVRVKMIHQNKKVKKGQSYDHHRHHLVDYSANLLIELGHLAGLQQWPTRKRKQLIKFS